LSQLDLNLPPVENPTPPSKKGGSPLQVVILIIAIVAAVGAWLPKEGGKPSTSVEVQVDSKATHGEFKEALLLKLKNAGAYKKAAEHLSLALAKEGLTPARQAKLLKERGDFYLLAREREQALSDFYLAEVMIEGNEEEKTLARELSQNIIETLRQMGQYAAVSDELARKNRKRQGGNGAVQDPTVAVVDGVELKMSDFRTKVEKMIQQRILSLKAQGLDAEKEKEMAESIRKQYSAPYEQMQFLQQWVSRELLYREALEWKLDQHHEYEAAMNDFKKGFLGQLLMRDKVSVGDVSDLDLKNYAEANRATLGLSTEAGNLPQAEIDAAKDKIVAAYQKEKSQELQQAFQTEMMKRHKVEIKREAFSEGAN